MDCTDSVRLQRPHDLIALIPARSQVPQVLIITCECLSVTDTNRICRKSGAPALHRFRFPVWRRCTASRAVSAEISRARPGPAFRSLLLSFLVLSSGSASVKLDERVSGSARESSARTTFVFAHAAGRGDEILASDDGRDDQRSTNHLSSSRSMKFKFEKVDATHQQSIRAPLLLDDLERAMLMAAARCIDHALLGRVHAMA